MKIVLLGTANPYRGGLASFNERLALECQNQGHEIEIYNFSLQYPNFLFPGKSQFRDEPIEDSVPNYRKINSVNPLNWIKIGLELKAKQPDLIIFRYWLPFMAPCYSVIAFIAKLNRKTKVLSLVDNAIPHEPKFYDIPVTRIFFKISDCFVAMSQKVVADFKTLSDKKIQIIPHPMYENYGSPISKSEARQKFELGIDDKVILFFGFIREYKGLDWLLEAMSLLEIKSQNIKLIIAGEFYVDREKYIDLAKKLDIEENIIWKTDFIPDMEVAQYFCSADCVILPYKSATQSGVTQVAYYYDTPIIATKVGGIEEFVADNKIGIMCEPYVSSIAQAISRFYSEKLESKFRENMPEEKKRFEWKGFVEQMMESIKN